jgi:hypothetical protein
MTIRTIALAALVTVPMIGSALASEAVSITPPLYREQARTTAAVHPASELTTTPRLVPAAEQSRTVAKVAEPEVTGSITH